MSVSQTPLRRRRLVLLASAGLVAGCGGGGGDAAAPAAPTLDIRSDVTGEARAPFTVSFYFSAGVTLPTGTLAFALSGGSVVAGSFRRINDRTYAVQVRPNASARGLIDLRVPAGAFADAGGTAFSTVAYAFAQPYDTLPPLATLSFAGPVNALGFITGAGTFTLTFSAVLDAPMAASALVVSAGTVAGFAKVSAAGQPDVYTFGYTPPPATAGGVVFELPPGSVASGGIANDTDFWNYGLATP